jgi:hypothetical protein
MLGRLRSHALHWVFGDGLQGEIAERGIDWLARETRKAVDRDPERLTSVRLAPGETYTVIARPRPTRTERKLAERATALSRLDERMSRPSRSQLRAARRLRAAQRRLDRRPPGTRRHRRAAAVERAAGRRFDRAMAPSRRLERVRRDRALVEAELAVQREANFVRARRGRGRIRPRSTVYS